MFSYNLTLLGKYGNISKICIFRKRKEIVQKISKKKTDIHVYFKELSGHIHELLFFYEKILYKIPQYE